MDGWMEKEGRMQNRNRRTEIRSEGVTIDRGQNKRLTKSCEAILEELWLHWSLSSINASVLSTVVSSSALKVEDPDEIILLVGGVISLLRP